MGNRDSNQANAAIAACGLKGCRSLGPFEPDSGEKMKSVFRLEEVDTYRSSSFFLARYHVPGIRKVTGEHDQINACLPSRHDFLSP